MLRPDPKGPRVCTKCGTLKVLGEFYRRSAACRSCLNTQRRKENRERAVRRGYIWTEWKQLYEGAGQ